MITSVNPATGQKLASFDPHTPAQVDAALTAAVETQRSWRRTSHDERSTLLTAIAAGLRADSEKYARTISLEMGKPIVEARGEIEKCAVTLEHYATHARTYIADEEIASNAAESGIVYDPLGVVLAVMPWNYPFWQLVRFLAPALAAGNGAILKHANNVPQSALALQEIVEQAGAPKGLFSALLVESDRVAAIIEDDRIAAVTLTGSTEVGRLVASQAGKALKRQVLELGGSDPFIVLADANVEEAARVAVKARFTNNGQSCVNAKRFIVDASIADHFVAAFAEGIRALNVGDPLDEETTVGPMARHNLRDALHEQVEKTLSEGAELVLGGEAFPGEGAFYAPTLLDHVKPGSTAFTEETFGPVAAVTRVISTEEAIRLANQTEFGLGAAIWTSDVSAARDLAREIDAGAVFINGMVASDARLPFGGIKASGYGRELGALGMREFMNAKTIWIGPAK